MQSSPPRGRSQSHYQTPSTSRSSHSRRRRPSLPRSPASRILADFQPRKDTQLPRPNVNTIPTGKTLRQKPALPTPPSSNSSATDIVQSDLPQWMLPHNRPRSSPSLDVEPAPTKKKIPGDLPDLPVPQFDQIRTCKRRQARLGYQNEMLYWQSKGREVVNGPTRRTLKGDTVEDELIYVSCVWHLRAFRPWHRKYALTEQLRSAIWGEPDESIETIREHYVAMVQHRPRAMTAGQLCLKWPMAFQQDGQPYTKYCKLWGLPHRSQQRADAVERKEPVLRSIEALQRRARTHASVRRTMGREEGTKREASPSDHR